MSDQMDIPSQFCPLMIQVKELENKPGYGVLINPIALGDETASAIPQSAEDYQQQALGTLILGLSTMIREIEDSNNNPGEVMSFAMKKLDDLYIEPNITMNRVLDFEGGGNPSQQPQE